MGYYQLQVTPSPLPSPPLSLLIPSFSIIALVIIEMHMLWLVEDCMISCYNHLTQGDYSRGSKFQNGCLTFCQCYTGCDKHDRKNTILKTTKDAYRFGITLLKRKGWWNLMNLLNSSGNWLLILIQVIQTIVAELTIFKLQQNLKALEQNYTKTIIHSRLSEDCWIMKQI